ncbi:thioredoxin-disulfide reductase [Vagococcus fluvialis]|uniref:thioredoxin-disulfide reductase n=1 Tax=Vagococcus fluvialis TaxID=2738 RepID=UPI0038735994
MYDVIVIGGGAAGMTAAMYSSRANLKTGVIESFMFGGQMMNTSDVENYPSIQNITGAELSEKIYDSSMRFGAETIYASVKKITLIENLKEVHTDNGVILARSIIIATGSHHRELGLDNERELAGKGVSYCAICDGAFFKDKTVTVIGGGDSAIEEAIFLTQYAEEVRVVHRREHLRAQKVLQSRALSNEKINFLWETEVESINGVGKLESVTLKNNRTKEVFDMNTDGMFVYVGLNPLTEPFEELGILDEHGWIITDENMKTSVDGIFAAGDVRKKNLRQIATAVGDGAIAGQEAYEFLSR